VCAVGDAGRSMRRRLVTNWLSIAGFRKPLPADLLVRNVSWVCERGAQARRFCRSSSSIFHLYLAYLWQDYCMWAHLPTHWRLATVGLLFALFLPSLLPVLPACGVLAPRLLHCACRQSAVRVRFTIGT
jgi:hypothetical protein